MRRLGFFILVVALPHLAQAQKGKDPADTTAINLADSTLLSPTAKVVTIDTYAKRFNPRKALLYSAIFPGAGQAYNKKYWKVPLVYGIIAGGIYNMDRNYDLYKTYKTQLFSLLNEPNPLVFDKQTNLTPSGNLVLDGKAVSPESKLNVDQLRNAVNRYRRDRDFGVLLLGIIYFMQLLDAHVDAHLKEFSLNPQMKVALEPSVQPTGLYGRSSGLSFKLKF